jgi:hypothetical protein
MEEQLSITHSDCVSVALLIQGVKHIHRIILSSVACLPLPHISTLSHKQHNFPGEKKLVNINVCFDFLYDFCLKHFSSKKNSAKYYHKCT